MYHTLMLSYTNNIDLGLYFLIVVKNLRITDCSFITMKCRDVNNDKADAGQIIEQEDLRNHRITQRG